MMLVFGFPLWILLIELVLSITFVIIVQCEYYKWSTFVFIVSLLSLQFLAKLPLISYVKEKPLSILIWAGILLVFGLTWSYVKWVSFLYNFREIREEKLECFHLKQKQAKQRREEEELKIKNSHENEISGRKSYLQSEIRDLLSVESKTDWDFLCGERYKFTPLSEFPRFLDYKSQIIGWVIFCIPSFIGTLLDNFVRKLVTFIITRFRVSYEWLSYKIVGDFPKVSNG